MQLLMTSGDRMACHGCDFVCILRMCFASCVCVIGVVYVSVSLDCIVRLVTPRVLTDSIRRPKTQIKPPA